MISFVRAAAFAAFVLVASNTMMPAWAGAADYRLQAVAETVQMGSGTTLAIRLLNSRGDPVSGALIVDARLDMAQQGMPEMATALTFVGSKDAGERWLGLSEQLRAFR